MNDVSRLYYAAINVKNNKLYTTASRALAVLGIADDLIEAEEKAEGIAQLIKGAVFHRKDIGTRRLINKKIEHINHLCHKSYYLL